LPLGSHMELEEALRAPLVGRTLGSHQQGFRPAEEGVGQRQWARFEQMLRRNGGAGPRRDPGVRAVLVQGSTALTHLPDHSPQTSPEEVPAREEKKGW
jgi:hypothetical protein